MFGTAKILVNRLMRFPLVCKIFFKKSRLRVSTHRSLCSGQREDRNLRHHFNSAVCLFVRIYICTWRQNRTERETEISHPLALSPRGDNDQGFPSNFHLPAHTHTPLIRKDMVEGQRCPKTLLSGNRTRGINVTSFIEGSSEDSCNRFNMKESFAPK